MSYYIEGTNYQGKEFSGEFNGKYYTSKLPKKLDSPVLHRIYVDEKMYHITDDEKSKIDLTIKQIEDKYTRNESKDKTYSLLFNKVINKLKSVSQEEAIIIMNDILNVKYEFHNDNDSSRWEKIET